MESVCLSGGLLKEYSANLIVMIGPARGKNWLLTSDRGHRFQITFQLASALQNRTFWEIY